MQFANGAENDRAILCRDSVEITIEVEVQPRSSHVYIQLDGVDAYYEKVTTGGSKVIYPLADRAYGMRDCRIADPDGNHIAFGEAIAADKA